MAFRFRYPNRREHAHRESAQKSSPALGRRFDVLDERFVDDDVHGNGFPVRSKGLLVNRKGIEESFRGIVHSLGDCVSKRRPVGLTIFGSLQLLVAMSLDIHVFRGIEISDDAPYAEVRFPVFCAFNGNGKVVFVDFERIRF